MTESDINSVDLIILSDEILHLGLINNKKLGLQETRLTLVLYEVYKILYAYGQLQKKFK